MIMIDQDIKKFWLRRLIQKNEPVSAAELKLAACNAFNAALTEGELDTYLTAMADSNLVDFTKDELEQTLVGLTAKGKIAAQRLIKIT